MVIQLKLQKILHKRKRLPIILSIIIIGLTITYLITTKITNEVLVDKFIDYNNTNIYIKGIEHSHNIEFTISMVNYGNTTHLVKIVLNSPGKNNIITQILHPNENTTKTLTIPKNDFDLKIITDNHEIYEINYNTPKN